MPVEAALATVLADFGDLPLSASGRRIALGQLRRIARCNRALCGRGEEAEPTAYEAWIVQRTRHALQRALSGWAGALRRTPPTDIAVQGAPDPDGPIPAAGLGDGFVPARIVPRVDVNRADLAALVALPGLGPVTAARLLESRRRDGPFATANAILERRIVSRNAYERLSPWVTAAPRAQQEPGFTTPALARFVAAPEPAALTAALRETGGAFAAAGALPDGASLERRFLATLGSCVAHLEAHANPHPAARVSAATVNGWFAHHARAATLGDTRSVPLDAVAMVKDSRYLPAALAVLGAARERLLVMMFFLRYAPEDPRYPVNALLDAVVAAHERVAVRVLLDRDAEGAPYGSRIINRDAFDHLTARGVPVRYDSEARVTHTKLIVADDRHVLVGSHNWTAGSLYAYDDMSLYADSPALCAQAAARFEARWDAAAKA